MGTPYRRDRKAAYGRSKERMLATLLASPTTGYTRRQLAMTCDISREYAQQLLKELQQERLVTRYRVAGSVEWKFQRVAL
jgi:DNA-binding IscR family transcriptional regulator